MTDGAPADLDRRTYPPHRINALADGVFAIAMTLLALEIRIPDDIGTEAAFRAELPALFGAIAVFLAGFWITAQYWIAHHRAMAHVHTVDGTAVVRTIAVLCGVAAVPVATSLITGWSRFPEAVAVAGMLLALTSLLSARLFSHVLAPGSADVDPAARRRMLATPLYNAVVYLLVVPLAYLVQALGASSAWALLALFLLRLDRVVTDRLMRRASAPSRSSG